MIAPGFKNAEKSKRVLRSKEGSDVGQLQGIGYLGGIALYNPDQDTLNSKQLLHISYAMLGLRTTQFAGRLDLTLRQEQRRMKLILDALHIERAKHSRLDLLPQCLALEILKIDTPSTAVDLPVNQDQLQILADLSEGQSRLEVAEARDVPLSTLHRQIKKMCDMTNSVNYSTLELAAFFTSRLVMNPQPFDYLCWDQIAVRREGNINTSFQIRESAS